MVEQNKQQSKNWERYGVRNEDLDPTESFSEGFPEGGPFGNASKTFELIVYAGAAPPIKTVARINYDRQYSAEGIQWEELNRQTVPKNHVMAWREK